MPRYLYVAWMPSTLPSPSHLLLGEHPFFLPPWILTESPLARASLALEAVKLLILDVLHSSRLCPLALVLLGLHTWTAFHTGESREGAHPAWLDCRHSQPFLSTQHLPALCEDARNRGWPGASCDICLLILQQGPALRAGK